MLVLTLPRMYEKDPTGVIIISLYNWFLFVGALWKIIRKNFILSFCMHANILLYSKGSVFTDVQGISFRLQLMDINESPVYLLLNPAINHAQKDLPITIFESGTVILYFFYLALKSFFLSIW